MSADQEQGLLDRVRSQWKRALASGQLQLTATEPFEIEDEGIRFSVRVVAGSDRKKHFRGEQARAGVDPFLPPYVDDLYVADISSTHVALLNKFPVLDDHLLIVTRADEPQQSWLTPRDFEALRVCMQEVEGLGFYNGGAAAGASQPHKHMQLVPIPVTTWSLLTAGSAGFACAASAIEPTIDGSTLWAIYRDLMNELALDGDRDPYNVLVSRDRLVIVPRMRHGYSGIPVNALGFAGSFLVRTREDLERLQAIGPRCLLAEVGRTD